MAETINRFTSKALVDKMRERSSLLASLPRSEAETAVSRVFDAITELLKDPEPIRVSGFGTFKLKLRAGRTARNPRTGETFQTQDKNVVTFKPGKTSA